MTDTEIMPVLDNPYLGLFFGKETQVSDSKMLSINLMFSPGEFSVSNKGHETFVRRVLSYAKTHKVAALGGTEAGQNQGNNTHQTLVRLGPDYGFDVTTNQPGEWMLISHDFGKVVTSGFVPVIPGEKSQPGQIGHNTRGILWTQVKPNDPRYGICFFGSSHYLTHGRTPNTDRGRQNLQLRAAIDEWGTKHGAGDNLVWHMADTNELIPKQHPYSDQWLTCWEEANTFPATHGRSTIDAIARRKADTRIRIKSAHALNDALLPLPVDHYSIVANYSVRPKGVKP